MRFYVPGDRTSFILGIRQSNNHQVNQALLDELLDDNMIFFDGAQIVIARHSLSGFVS